MPSRDATAPDGNALRNLVVRSRAWGQQAEDLPRSVTCALWVIAAGSVGVGTWLAAVLTGHASCSSVVCMIATMNHPRLLMVLASFCVAALLGLAPFTGGLTRAGGLQLAVMTVAAVAGAGSLLGVAAVVVLTVTVALMAVVALVLLLDRD
jgi:hypothetical protein